jgi:xylulokinase
MSDRFVVAFDVGTSGVKAVLADLSCRVVASRYEPYGLRAAGGGRVEQDVEEIYDRLAAACRSLLGRPGVTPGQVEAVSVTAQMFNVVPVGAAGEPLAPMLSWLDTRAAPQAAALAAEMGADEQFRRLGATITAKDILPRILWLKQELPEVYARTSKLLDCKEVVVALLTGELVTDHAGASAYRLADLDAGAWDAGACQAAGVSPALLPDVAAATDLAGTVTDAAAAETGLLRGTPVVVGAGDVPASQVGAGATEHGDAHVSLGTAVYFGITLDRPAIDPGRQLGVLGHMDPKRFILWLEIATGGGALAWLLGLLGQPGAAPDYAEVDRLVAERLDDGGSLLFAPWLSGERVPVFDDRARAAFVGLDLSHDKGHLLRALMEGVAYQMRWALEYAAAFGEPIGALRAVGGGGIGAAWTQIIADVLDRPLLTVRDPQDAAARGAAACALVGIGVEPDLAFARRMAEVERTVDPVPARRPRHQRLYADYQALYQALAPHYHRTGR